MEKNSKLEEQQMNPVSHHISINEGVESKGGIDDLQTENRLLKVTLVPEEEYNRLKNLELENKRLIQENQNLLLKYAEQGDEVTKLKDSNNKLQLELAKLQGELKVIQEKGVQQSGQLNQLTEENSKLRGKLKNMNKEIKGYKTEMRKFKALQDDYDNLKTKIESMSDYQELKTNVNKLMRAANVKQYKLLLG
eukprot:TRINITY_DN17383_c0_g1_i1.p1 TRINITY_DN17383_c0_g1~~TRINITY_DN17383_c0_g1_i1.p1  ORF type:complete len:193 (-),score=44.57 TRINITY_DN17383_c0_g1_i1:184-762(-)